MSLRWSSSSCGAGVGLASRCGVRAAPRGGFSFCETRALGLVASVAAVPGL